MPKKKIKTSVSSSHKRFSPSKSSRWLNCPGSIPLSDDVPPQPTSIYAAEGTAAHALGELCLNNDTRPEDYYGDIIEKFVVDDEMVDGIDLYIDTVLEDFENSKEGTELYVEYNVEMNEVHEDTGGTSDVIIDRPGDRLTAYDLKYGKWEVEAENNTQGLNYLLGYMLESPHTYKDFEFVIVQPRLENEERRVKRWVVKKARLVKFHKEILAAIDNANSDDPTFCEGDWCKYCPAAGICPLLHNRALEIAQADFTPVEETIDLKAPTDLTPSQLTLILNNAHLIENWLKSVAGHALGLLQRGEHVPGFKLVRGRANRQWRENVRVPTRLKKLGVSEDDMYTEPKLKSPAQIEKIVGKGKVDKLITKGEGKITIAPESDKRPESPPSAQLDFEEYDD